MKFKRRIIFEFLCEILADKQRLNVLGLMVIIFLYLQIFAAQFAPFLYQTSKKGGGIKAFIKAFAFFASNQDDYIEEIYLIYIFCIAFIIISLWYFWAFYQRRSKFGIYKSLRTVVRIFPVVIFVYPLAGHAGLKLNSYMNKSSDWFSMFLIVLDLVLLGITVYLEYLLTPVIAGSPLCGSAHIPSRVLPEFEFTKYVIHDFISFLLLLSSQSAITIYLYCIFQMLNAIMRIANIIQNPFCSVTHTNLTITLSITSIFIQIGYFLSENTYVVRPVDVFVYAIIFFPLCFTFIAFAMNYSNKRIQDAIECSNIKYLCKIHPQRILNMIIGKDIRNDALLDLISHHAKGRLKLLIKILRNKFTQKHELMIETDSYLFSFVIFRMIKREKLIASYKNDSEQFDSYKFWKKVMNGQVNEIVHEIYNQSKDAIFSLQELSTDNPLQENLCKLMKREKPIQETLALISIFILIISFTLILFFPIFRMSANMSKIIGFPSILKKSLNIGLLWSHLMLGIEHSVNCTRFNNMSYLEVVKNLKINIPEQSYVEPVVIANFNNNLDNLAYVVTKEVNLMNKLLNNLEIKDFFHKMQSIWFTPRVVFPLFVKNNQTKMDMRSILIYYMSEIITYNDPVDVRISRGNRCSSSLTNHMRKNMFEFMNSSLELLLTYTSFVNGYLEYIHIIQAQYQVDIKDSHLIHVAIMSVLCLVIDVLWHYWRYNRIYQTIIEHFRVTVHPTNEEVGFKQEVTRLNLYFDIRATAIFHFIGIAVFITFCLLFRVQSNRIFDDMLKYNMITVNIENLSLTFTQVMHAYFRSYLFKNTQFSNQFLQKIYDFEYTIATIEKSFSPFNLKRFVKSENLPSLMRYNETIYVLKSFHDIYSTWPLTQLTHLLNSMIRDTPRILPLDPNSEFYLHLSHINLDHFQPGVNQIHEQMSQLSESALRFFDVFVGLDVLLFSFFLILAYMVIYNEYLRFERCDKILNYHILMLDPIFILTQNCLMDYLIVKKQKYLSPIYFMADFYRTAQIPIIFLGHNDTIVQFSTPVLLLFGRREDQLIGHKIQSLILEDHSRFYYHVHNKIQSTHTVKGHHSNDMLINLEIDIKPLDKYVLLQFKNIDEIMNIEELIQVHQELYDEYLTSTFPKFVYQNPLPYYNQVSSKTFPKYSFLLMKIDIKGYDEDSHIMPMKHHLSESIVMFMTCSLWCIFFVGEDYLVDAVKCYEEFDEDPSRKAGIILEGSDLVVYFYGIEDGIRPCDPETIMNLVPPYISMEPRINAHKCFSYLSKLVMGKLIGDGSLKKYTDCTDHCAFNDKYILIDNKEIKNMKFYNYASATSFFTIE